MRPKPSLVVPSLLNFRDYREYLREIRDALLSRRRTSLTQWTRHLGYRSPRSLGMVLAGKRLPSREMKERLGKWLNFSMQERRYFDLLVEKRRQELRGRSAAELLGELERLGSPAYSQTVLKADILPFVSQWFHLVVKQLLSVPGARSDVDWLYLKLRNKVSRHHLRESVERLVRLGFFRWDEPCKKWIPLQGNIQTTRDIPSAAIRMHHRGMLHRALQALEEDPVDKRDFTTLTFRARREDVELMKKRIKEFREAFDQEFEAKSSEEVYQLNVQLFSHT